MATEPGIDLNLATTDELWYELRERYVASMLVYVLPCREQLARDSLGIRVSSMNAATIRGMAEFARLHADHELKEEYGAKEAENDDGH